MTLTPVNNYLSVRTVEDTETEDSGILLPQDYRAVESPFAVVEVVNCSGETEPYGAPDCRLLWKHTCSATSSTTARPSRSSRKTT
jgi:hypothetical protein